MVLLYLQKCLDTKNNALYTKYDHQVKKATTMEQNYYNW